MPNTAKSEAIRKAYGDLYERYKNRISQYSGWLELDNLFMSREDYDLRDNEALEFKNERGYYCFRPKSLQGIENNNGWKRIESEEDLPKEGMTYYLICIDSIPSLHPHNLKQIKSLFVDGMISHWQPIVKPEKPIY